jgi:conjugative relaxase-like TrwC/TraI family protein
MGGVFVVMTLHKLTAGDGYTYLTRHIAGGDRDLQPGQDPTEYYTAEGNPPGRWGGRGAGGLGLSGTVTEAQMRHLFGQGMHPDADLLIDTYLREHTRDGMSAEQLERVKEKAIRHATLGRRFPIYQTLEDFDTRVNARLNLIRAETGRAPTEAEIGKTRADEARRARGAVAGYDLVFTPVKSLVLLWALDERPWVRQAVRAIHEQARDSALALLEEHAAFTRTGDTGQAQLATRGLVYAVFDHYDSRDGDPNLHSHVTISGKIQGEDGIWRSIDGRALHRIAVAASEHYNSQVETLGQASLGLGFATRTDTAHKRHPVREIIGMPLEYLRTFSQRRQAIDTRYDELIVDFRRTHGHDPDHQSAFRLAERANLDTRGPKPLPRSLTNLRADWRQRLTVAHGPGALKLVIRLVTASAPTEVPPPQAVELSDEQITALATLTIGRVEQARSTWTVWNLRAEAERLLRDPPTTVCPQGAGVADHNQRVALVGRVVGEAVAGCVPVTVQPDLNEPAGLRRPDGASVFVEHAAARYTSQALLDAEARLLEAAQTRVRTLGLTPDLVAELLDRFETSTGTKLDPGQRAMVIRFATDPHLISVGLGPAGAGKTTTMRAYQQVLSDNGQRLIPLAASSAAAAVLSRELNVPAENVHKFVYDHLTGTPPSPSGTWAGFYQRFFQLRHGDVILVDEAGLAGTRNLDTLRELATRFGATLRLLGDHRQLSAPESGGALRLLATTVGAVELNTLHRFTSPAEADATRQLRDGDTRALDFYSAERRIAGGSAEAMIEQAYTAWQKDMNAGMRSLMLASTTTGVTALSARARADRVTAGQVEPDGVTLHDGNLAGRGDWIVTRDNQRTMTCNRGRDWVRNGDAWTITHRNRDGSLKVRHLGHGGTITLPADYVTANVELLYATTVHRAQGATVDTTHALITQDMTRETLYVAATRARQSTTLYAVTHQILPVDEDARMDRTIYDRHARAAREILETVLATEGAQPSATEAVTKAKDDANSLATLVPRLRHALEKADHNRLREVVTTVLGQDASGVCADTAWPSVARALRTAETQGWDLPQLLAATARRGPLSKAESPAELLAWRIGDHTDGSTPPPPLAQPTQDDVERYSDLLRPILASDVTIDPDQGTGIPRLLHTDPHTGNTNLDKVLRIALGDSDTERVTNEQGWPALRAAIRRAEYAGHDPLKSMFACVLSRPLGEVQSLSQVLAWRLAQYVEITPPPVGKNFEDADGPEAWRQVAWTIKAAEQAGHPAETLLETMPVGVGLEGVRHHLRQHLRPAPTAGVLPWLAPTPQTSEPEFAAYLTEVNTAITARVSDLNLGTTTSRPRWLSGLGERPIDPQPEKRWIEAARIVAAYRDQYQITTDDPTQPLGPYVPSDRAAHTAFLHAADAVLTARRPGRFKADPGALRIAIDVYLALSDTDRETITATIARRLGTDWLGPQTGDADTLLTAPAYATHLHQELLTRGAITGPELDPSRTQPTGPTRRPMLFGPVGASQAPMESQRQPIQMGIEISW